MARVHNFNPGPAALPLPVLEQIRDEMLDYKGTGMSVLESSHRGKDILAMHEETKALLRELGGFGPEFHIMFLGGGASTQFYMVPMNLLKPGESADYINTGTWATAAIKEAKIVAKCNVAGSTESEEFTRLPRQDELKLDPNAVYLHFTSNNTIRGTQWKKWPDAGKVPLVCDMSSDFFWRPFDPKPFGLIYGGAQKNLGPAGVTYVFIRQDMLDRCRTDLPTMIKYKVHVEKDSMHNTPPVFPIYVVNLVLKWVKAEGGLQVIEKRNLEKARLVYDCVDSSGGYYRGTVKDPGSRSTMNLTIRMQSEELEEKFFAAAGKAGLKGLKGHRSVGGIRVSAYNAVSLDSIKACVDFMKDFQKKNG